MGNVSSDGRAHFSLSSDYPSRVLGKDIVLWRFTRFWQSAKVLLYYDYLHELGRSMRTWCSARLVTDSNASSLEIKSFYWTDIISRNEVLGIIIIELVFRNKLKLICYEFWFHNKKNHWKHTCFTIYLIFIILCNIVISII